MHITKASFLKYLDCPTFAWRESHAPKKQLPKKDEVRIREGKLIGEKARTLFPEGILIDTLNIELATEITKTLLNDKQTNIIFEPAFKFRSFVARADILIRTSSNAWKLVEVKSSIHKKDEVEKEHLRDAAFTAFVIRGAGLTISDIELMRISKLWRKGMPDNQLFGSLSILDLLEEANALIEKSASLVSTLPLKDKAPNARICVACKACDYFKVDCVGKDIKHPLFEIPRIDKKKLLTLYDEGIYSIVDLPDEFLLAKPQERVVTAVKTNKPQINKKKLTEILSKVVWPSHYLEFETVKSDLPFWDNIAPHEQIETQFSLHICEAPGKVVSHDEFLASHEKDPRREFTENLIQVLGEKGSIIVYSNFEKTTLKRLSALFPEYSKQLSAIDMRLLDLEEVFKEAYCHPDFSGRTSIKKVLPVLIPDMTYEGLEIAGGDAAIAAFIELTLGSLSEEEILKTRQSLLTYCHQDTLAMVKLHEKIAQEALQASVR